MRIEYDTPIEVDEKRYNALMRIFCGIIAGRCEGGRYWIKVWFMKYAPQIEKYL